MSSQQSRSQIYTRFCAVNALDWDEVHLSVRWFLDVPYLARPSRPCKYRPRPCSRRLPAAGAFFVLLFFQTSIRTYQFDKLSSKKLSTWTDRLLSFWPRRLRFESSTRCAFFQFKNMYDRRWLKFRLSNREAIHIVLLALLPLLLCVLLVLFFLFGTSTSRALSQQSSWPDRLKLLYCTLLHDVRACIRMHLPAAVWCVAILLSLLTLLLAAAVGHLVPDGKICSRGSLHPIPVFSFSSFKQDFFTIHPL